MICICDLWHVICDIWELLSEYVPPPSFPLGRKAKEGAACKYVCIYNLSLYIFIYLYIYMYKYVYVYYVYSIQPADYSLCLVAYCLLSRPLALEQYGQEFHVRSQTHVHSQGLAAGGLLRLQYGR